MVVNDILTETRFWMHVLGDAKRTVVCSPANEEQIKSYVDARGVAGLIEVMSSPFVKDDQILLADTGAMQAMFNQSLHTMRRSWLT